MVASTHEHSVEPFLVGVLATVAVRRRGVRILCDSECFMVEIRKRELQTHTNQYSPFPAQLWTARVARVCVMVQCPYG